MSECEHTGHAVCKKCGERSQKSKEALKITQLQDVAAEFVELIGGRMIVVSGPEIRGPVGGKHKYELVISYMGKAPKGNQNEG